MEQENKDEEKVSNAEIFEPEEENVSEEIGDKKRKTDFYVELALFCILGLLIGIAVKTEADKRVTIGFNDYKMKIMKQDYDVNKLQVSIAQKKASESQQQEGVVPNGQVQGDNQADQNQALPSN
jgi:hypothetical protein